MFGFMVVAGLLGFVAGCPFLQPPADPCADVTCGDGETCDDGVCVPGEDPQEFKDADLVRGGTMYDKWWKVAGVDEPTDDHPFWATQDTNERSGADTWRCKECHGWDYKGVDGAYGSGSHKTGFAGIFGIGLSAQATFDKIKDDHGFGAAGLSDGDIWDLAKFVLEGQIDTDDIIDGDAFTGDVANGQTLYESGIGTSTACSGCHGDDGLAAPPGVDPEEHDEFVGLIANENPWEFQHKVRFGQPDTAMPSAVAGGGSIQDVADLSAYAQTLPEGP